MREYVFLGWSRNRNLAICVKERLDKLGCPGVIGGDYEYNPEGFRFRNSTVNNTVTNQMLHCQQAIMLFQKNENNTISGNLVYELGFFSSKNVGTQTAANIHIFKIDISAEDEKVFPSDLHGVWGHYINTDQKTDDELADEIVLEFVRCQQMMVKEDKLQLLNNYRHIEYEIDYHVVKSQISDYELALKIIFYIQAAFVFQEPSIAQQKCEILREQIARDSFRARELKLALDYAVLTFEMFKLAVPSEEDENGKVHLQGKVFRKFIKEYKALASLVYKTERDEAFKVKDILFSKETLERGNREFEMWFISQLQEHISYLFLIYLDNPELAGEERAYCLEQAVLYGAASSHNLELLETNEEDSYYAKLLRSYAERNLSLFYSMMEDREKSVFYEERSFKLRKILYDKVIKSNRYNPELKNYIALEYFIQIADSFSTITNPYEIQDNMEEMREYVKQRNSYETNRSLMYSRLLEVYKELEAIYSKVDEEEKFGF